MNEECNCELRNRAWNLNTGKCQTCHLPFPPPSKVHRSQSGEAPGAVLSGVSARRVEDRPTLRVAIYRAEDTTRESEDVPNATLTISSPPPKQETLDDSRTFYRQQARALHDVLARTLPGGTLDALLGELLERKASLFRIRMPEAFSYDSESGKVDRQEMNRLREIERVARLAVNDEGAGTAGWICDLRAMVEYPELCPSPEGRDQNDVP